MAEQKNDPRRGASKPDVDTSLELTPPSPPPAPVETQRRVYALPADLVERIVEFQKEKGYPSEVEAARRLLDDALKSRDTVDKIISRFMTRLGSLRITTEVAKDVLVGHPLIKSMSFGQDSVSFLMKDDDWQVSINDKGNVTVLMPRHGTKGPHWIWKPKGPLFGPGEITIDEADDIPF